MRVDGTETSALRGPRENQYPSPYPGEIRRAGLPNEPCTSWVARFDPPSCRRAFAFVPARLPSSHPPATKWFD